MKYPTGKTVGGYRFRIYAGNGGGPFPVHGAVWSKELRMWVGTTWTLTGVNHFLSKHNISPRVMARIEEENSPI